MIIISKFRELRSQPWLWRNNTKLYSPFPSSPPSFMFKSLQNLLKCQPNEQSSLRWSSAFTCSQESCVLSVISIPRSPFGVYRLNQERFVMSVLNGIYLFSDNTHKTDAQYKSVTLEYTYVSRFIGNYMAKIATLSAPSVLKWPPGRSHVTTWPAEMGGAHRPEALLPHRLRRVFGGPLLLLYRRHCTGRKTV